jgi:hypothetical protein
MNKPNKPRSFFAELFSPGAGAYNERRSWRILIVSILAGIVIAVAFGFALYYLNKNHRI